MITSVLATLEMARIIRVTINITMDFAFVSITMDLGRALHDTTGLCGIITSKGW